MTASSAGSTQGAASAASIDSLLPLRPVEFYILLSLSEGETHGYAIVQDTEERSGGSIELDTGTLYRALVRLREQGLVEQAARRPAEESGHRQRRYYRLTELGRGVAAAEARRMAGLVHDARRCALLVDPESAS